MEHSYIRFGDPSSTNAKRAAKTKGILQKFIGVVVSTFITKANPDFESVIDNVAEWLLEICIENNKTNREIGIDKNGQTILIMPWCDNCGYWSDNSMTLDYFRKHFKVAGIEKVDFETRWNGFIKGRYVSENYEFDKRGFSKYYRYLEQNGWEYDGAMTFAKGNNQILFDTSESFYIERSDKKIHNEFQCRNLAHFTDIIENNTSH